MHRERERVLAHGKSESFGVVDGGEDVTESSGVGDPLDQAAFLVKRHHSIRSNSYIDTPHHILSAWVSSVVRVEGWTY
jgi:hypothetical protein